ncbi:hypothetical protein ACH5RR_008294 [Cinchona calisaya]|uniref:Uncharacterized protein n=1 Tax=Cinchona calisaya TaxID=153742 RepID=A0ABD3AB92_9GENT
MDGELGDVDSEKKLQHQLIDAGVKLLAPPSSTDDLLAALDKVEDLLSNVGQDPSSSIQDGLLPSMKALICDGLFRHPDMDVKISVMSCICEVLRITAPHQPYEDERMKEIFQLTLAAFEKLSLFSGRCYSKALHILETVAKVRCCVILLDLGCDALVIEIFKLLLSTIRFNHPPTVFSNMEEIMTWLIDESDEISLSLLKPLLASVKKENRMTSPISSWLGENVLKNCSAKVKPYLMKAVKSMRLNVNDYADIVASLCQDMPAGDNVVMLEAETNASHLLEAEAQLCKSVWDDGPVQAGENDDNRSEDRHSSKTSECHEQIQQPKSTAKESVAPEALESGGELQARTSAGIVPSRRERKPNSLIKPEEGYEHSEITGNRTSLEISRKRKNHGKASSLPNNSSPEKPSLHPESVKENKQCSFPPRTSHLDGTYPSISLDQSDGGKSLKKSGRPKEKVSMVSQDVNLDDTLDAKGTLLQDQLEKKNLQGSDGRLRIGSYKAKVAEEKPGRYSRRKRPAVKNNTETTSSVENADVKKEKDLESDSEGKPPLLLGMKDGKKGMEDKKTEESEGSKKPRIVKEYDEELVGSRIKVWWPMDSMFYEGVIDSFDPLKKKHKILYVDGDKEILKLKKERWFLLDDTASDQDKERNLPSSVVALPVQGQKMKVHKKNKTKQDDSVTSERRSQGQKSGSKSAERSAVDTLCIKTEIDVPAKEDEETLRSETHMGASKSSMSQHSCTITESLGKN